MKRLVLLAAFATATLATTAHAQVGGVVFDPTQSGHAIQQLVQETGTDAIALKVKKEFAGKEKARFAEKPPTKDIAKAQTKPAKKARVT